MDPFHGKHYVRVDGIPFKKIESLPALCIVIQKTYTDMVTQ